MLDAESLFLLNDVSMIALGGPKLKPGWSRMTAESGQVSMIALGGPKLKLHIQDKNAIDRISFNDSTGWA